MIGISEIYTYVCVRECRNVSQDSLLACSADTLLYRFIINVTRSTFKRKTSYKKIAYSRNGVLDVDTDTIELQLYKTYTREPLYFVKYPKHLYSHTCMYNFQYALGRCVFYFTFYITVTV